MMRFLSVVAVVVFAILAVRYGPTAVTRLFDADTKLGLFEERISNIPREFERRSPEFSAVWEDFKGCMEYEHSCDPSLFLARRDKVVKKDWPEIFDRLLVEGDWGRRSDSFGASARFFDALETHGVERLRNQCVPKIEFRRIPGGNRRSVFRMAGYECA